MKPSNPIIAVVAIIAIALGIWTSWRVSQPPPSPKTATVLPAPTGLPDFSLLDHDGDPAGPEVFTGHWNLVFFGFTYCPDVCPLTLQVLSNALRQLQDAGQAPMPRIVLVSVDPERDTPEKIGEYVHHFGEDNVGLTGEIEEVRKLTDGLGIYFQKTGDDPDTYTVDHSSAVLLINPHGQFHGLFGSPHEAANYVHDLPIIMASWSTSAASAPLVAGDIEIARPTPTSAMAAGYLSLRNNSDEPIAITGVSSPNFGRVDMHETVTDDGVSKMRPVEVVTIPPGRVLYFKRGGKHLMLMRPTGPADTVTLTFHSGDTAVLTVSVPVDD